MKTLYVARHAKSSWEHAGLDDHDRPLLEKGKKRTRKIIEYLLSQDVTFDFIISSTAVRAAETAVFIAKACNYPLDEIKFDPAIYHANAKAIFDQFLDLDDAYKSVLIVGHNPTFTNFVNHFMKPPIDWLPTSGVVCIRFDTDKWDQISVAPHQVVFAAFPKLM